MSAARRREWAGRLGLAALGFALALALLAALELALRLAGLGGGDPGYDPFAGFSSSVPLFERTTRADGSAGWRVSRARLARQGGRDADDPLRAFAAEKPAGAFRIFTVGESSAAGIPYAPSDSFSGVLARALAAALPELRVEVVDAAISGYGSRRELLAVRELARHEPDLIVFYGGHNEPWERTSYGAWVALPGPLFQLLERLVATRSFGLASQLLGPARERPEQAVDRFVREDARQALDLFAAGRDRMSGRTRLDGAEIERWYLANVERIADAARDAGARLALVSLGQDLADWPPPASVHRPDLGPDALARWTALVDDGIRARERGDCAAALAAWREALRLDDGFALLHFRIGECERLGGRYAAARDAFRRASDLDALPAGAPTRYNERLRALAARRGAIFVDAASALEAAAPNGLVGRELFVDPLHPSLRGHQVIGTALAEALRAAGVPRPAAQWRALPEPEPLERILARHPDYPARELEMALVVCLLAQDAACAEEQAGALLALDPENGAARRALEHLRSPRSAGAER